MFDLTRFTLKAQETLQKAHQSALQSNHQFVESVHLFKASLDDENISFYAFDTPEKSSDLKVLKNKVDDELRKIPQVQSSNQQIYISQNLANLLQEALKIAEKWGDSFVSQECLFYALTLNFEIKKICGNTITPENVEKNIMKMRKGSKVDTETKDQSYQNLEKFTQNLTASARDGKLDPVIGRDEEIRRAIQVLCRRTKNNPVLIGEPGVGKTAIVEGLAQRIVKKDVPEILHNATIRVLDLASMLAGAKYRGDFEERLKSLLKEVTESDENIVLFIDELHTLVGAGKSDGAMDASNMLKPALARGELHCIGATTLDEYRQYIEKDPALARRFQAVYVSEPTVEDTISILRGLKEKYELHHGVRISDSAIVAASTFSNRYIADRFLPDKAIDLMDEAASRLRMVVDSKPEDIDELDRRILQLRIEKEALKKETDLASQERLKKLENELEDLSRDSQKLNDVWQKDKKILDDIRSSKTEIDHLKMEQEKAQTNGDFTKASEILYSRLPALQAKLESLYAMQNGQARKEEVTEQDIAFVVSRWTGIPLEKMLQGEKEKLIHLEEELSKKVVGQTDALKALSNAVRRARSGLQDPNRPLGSFLFLGPTGVGKTELCKALAHNLFDHEENMIRFDMSEYMEKHSISRLIGAPPGYVGFDQGGTLTEAIRRRPYAVILFDEVEKAHPDVFNLLLQVLDDGRLTDSQGHTVDFKNTIIVLTSNIGANHLFADDAYSAEGCLSESTKKKIMQQVHANFRPEFINRLDEIVIFNRLRLEDMRIIVNIQLKGLIKRLEDQRIHLTLSDLLIDWLAEQGFDPLFGARPLKRLIQSQVIDALAMKILSGETHEGDSVIADFDGEKVVIKIN
ncbi:MAG: ATP-dependent chaperone ClpB [Candidatus Puniceispirillum sp.]|nr:ATP-dependent chaperone ClpB [Candidatus Pelagibacter sp.]MBA4282804.1 ATP-dependent chaperone ClpB [Candidatus Puniceispirillum sp.]